MFVIKPLIWYVVRPVLREWFVIHRLGLPMVNRLSAKFEVLSFIFSKDRNTLAPFCGSHHTITVLRPFFRDHPGEPVPEENFWTLWCKGRLTEADTPTIRLGATPSRLTSAHFHYPPIFLQAGCPSCRPVNNVKALKAYEGSQWWLDFDTDSDLCC